MREMGFESEEGQGSMNANVFFSSPFWLWPTFYATARIT